MRPTLAPALRDQMDWAHAVWQRDRRAGVAGVDLPHALAHKYPRAPLSWAWHWVFPQAMRGPGIHKPASPHTLRHSFATHLLQQGALDHLTI